MAGVLSNIMLTIGNLNNCVITMCCQRLVCDLQGGYYGDYYILTDPVIEVRATETQPPAHQRPAQEARPPAQEARPMKRAN